MFLYFKEIIVNETRFENDVDVLAYVYEKCESVMEFGYCLGRIEEKNLTDLNKTIIDEMLNHYREKIVALREVLRNETETVK